MLRQLIIHIQKHKIELLAYQTQKLILINSKCNYFKKENLNILEENTRDYILTLVKKDLLAKHKKCLPEHTTYQDSIKEKTKIESLSRPMTNKEIEGIINQQR